MLSILFALKGDDRFTNKYTLLGTGIIGLSVPVVNGVVTGNWLWQSATNDMQSFIVDLLWLLIAVTALFVVYRLRRKAVAV